MFSKREVAVFVLERAEDQIGRRQDQEHQGEEEEGATPSHCVGSRRPRTVPGGAGKYPPGPIARCRVRLR